MSDVPILVPEGRDLSDLTLGELDTISREIKSDVLTELTGKGYMRWGALARVAHKWAKRTDPGAKLETYLAYEVEDLTRALRMDEATPDPTRPTGSSGPQ